jgi:hypothetical protein
MQSFISGLLLPVTAIVFPEQLSSAHCSMYHKACLVPHARRRPTWDLWRRTMLAVTQAGRNFQAPLLTDAALKQADFHLPWSLR